MKTWRIPVSWLVCAVIEVQANSLSEALDIATDEEGKIPLPDNPEYVDGSWEVYMDDIDALRSVYNNNQSDEKIKEE